MKDKKQNVFNTFLNNINTECEDGKHPCNCIDKENGIISKEKLEEKYEPSEKFMSVERELEDLKQNLNDKVVLTKKRTRRII